MSLCLCSAGEPGRRVTRGLPASAERVGWSRSRGQAPVARRAPLEQGRPLSPRQGRVGEGHVGRGLSGELGAHLVAVPPLPCTDLLSCWELAPRSLPLNLKSGCPQTHSLLQAWVPERPPSPGPVLSRWEGTHFWGHTDRVQVRAPPPASPGTSPLWVSAPCSRASLCSQLPRRLWGLTVKAIPGTEGTETLLGELTLFILTSSHDESQPPPPPRTAPVPRLSGLSTPLRSNQMPRPAQPEALNGKSLKPRAHHAGS